MKSIFGHNTIVSQLTEEQIRMRLVLLMDAVQYTINRLDTDESQPQVASDLAVALAAVKSEGG